MSLDLSQLPVWPQRQDSLADQMADLVRIANRLGFYDAADAVTQLSGKLGSVRYGCHVDLEEGQEPDGCVIDTNNHHDCIYAKDGMRKEQCEYWRICTPVKNEATL